MHNKFRLSAHKLTLAAYNIRVKIKTLVKYLPSNLIGRGTSTQYWSHLNHVLLTMGCRNEAANIKIVDELVNVWFRVYFDVKH
jgi:hypothetical protein